MAAYEPYEPRTLPSFPGDDWHELRDLQMHNPWDALSRMAGLCADFYLRAAKVLDRDDDAAAQCLRDEKNFDFRTLYVTYAHMAAYWRYSGHLPDPMLPGMSDLDRLRQQWHDWAIAECTLWCLDNPRLVRLFCLVLVQQNTADGIVAEWNLWDEIKEHYPLPPNPQRDLFAPPDSPYG
ncbi:MAG: hypothetical protein LCH69_06260 [Proteobacteria bacterium]|nr:hypothetical protein [Pseudomonadota bacterium]